MDCVLDFKEVCDHWSHTLIVFGEDGLKYRKVVLSHLVSNLIDNINELSVYRILTHVKDRWLQTFGYHVISVQDFLRKDDKN